MKRMHFVFPLLLVVLMSFAGCVRRADEAAPVSDDSGGTGTPSTGQGTGDTGTPLRLTPEGQSRVAGAPPRPVDPRDSAFEAERPLAFPAYPSDFDIGGLTTASSVEPELADAYEAVALVLGTLVTSAVSIQNSEEETVDQKLTSADDSGDSGFGDRMNPGGRIVWEELSSAASPESEFRIGTLLWVDEDQVSAEFRVTRVSVPGESVSEYTAVGELIVTKMDPQWYISDIQVTYRERPSNEVFEPGNYRTGSLW